MEENPKPTYVMDWTALLAYLMIGVAIILGLNFAIDMLADRYGFRELIETGRRRDLGFLVALLIGLPVTRLIGKLLDLAPRRVKSQ